MFRTFACLTEQHAPGLVVVAALVCWFSNIAAFHLLQQANDATDPIRRIGWRAAASFAVGAGIWCTHFIAMLGYDPGVVVGYEVTTTLGSLAVAVLATQGALLVYDRAGSPAGIAGAGVITGLGIAAMHYVGMAGVQIPGTFIWDEAHVAASVIAGCLLAPLALLVFARRMTRWPVLAAASILTAAIAAVHFIGMGGVEAIHNPSVEVAALGLPRPVLAIGIAAAVFGILAFAALGLLAERLHLSHAVKSAQLNAALKSMSQGLCMFDPHNRLILSNPRFKTIFNLPDGAVVPGMHLRDMIEAGEAIGNYPGQTTDDIYNAYTALISTGEAGVFHRHLTGDRTVSVSYVPMEDGGWLATFEDVSERTRNEAQIAYLAHHDALTGLPNRVRFRQELDRALARAKRGEKLSVLCLDLDHFKSVNDTLGHPVGDALLKEVATRLRSCLRESDTVARLGGDEFAIVQVGASEPQHSVTVAQRIIDALSAPFDLGGHQVVIGTSVGVVLAPDDSDDPDRLLTLADMALYRAKGDGRGTYRFFEAEMDAKMQSRRMLELDLRRAVVGREFEVYYQPLVNLETSRVSGFEALLRWNHAERGWVSPAEFIPLAEEIGLITEIGAWVLRQACTAAATWPEDVRVAVNLSSMQFKSRTLISDVTSALQASGLSAHRLELEITETVMLQDTEATLSTLHQLRNLGVRISMDDFGTGYSSLSYLRKFPFDKIKIDRSFIKDLPLRSGSGAIVKAITGMSASLGMSTTAEGVETQDQLTAVRSEGCTEVQGYFFSRPRPASEVAGLIASIGAEIKEAA
jgi:diguanylate cyclase (GGDEF)-like protein